MLNISIVKGEKMKTVGIIAEYNPFHNGHKYQIEKAKEITGADTVIVIMSGSFTQQGNIAIADKFKRAEIAIKNGADLVIELPTIFATSSAEMFAYGAVNILDKLNTVDYLVFGTECDNIDVLNSIVDKLIINKDIIDTNIKNEIKNGISYASARDNTLRTILTEIEYDEFSKPNNILAIEYLKSLKAINSRIKPIAIQRKSANHNDKNIKAMEVYASATSIRNKLEETNNIFDVILTIPDATYKLLRDSKLIFNEDMYKLLRYKILALGKENIKNIYDVNEGLENKIYDSVLTSKTYDELINNIKSKRYTMSRIKRILTHVLLNITKEEYDALNSSYYARILKINKSNNILGILNKNTSIPIVANINDNNIDDLDEKTKIALELDFSSTNIYQVISNSNLNLDKTNMI